MAELTDVILESKDGKRLHYFIDDNYPAIVYVREDGTLRLKRLDRRLEDRVIKLLKGLEGC